MMSDNPGFYRRRVGDLVVTALNDGYLDAPLAIVPGIEPEQLATLLRQALRASPPRLTLNAFLVQGPGRTILIDAGGGSHVAPTCGRLLGTLAAAGVQPTDVTDILLTHLHGDHVGGLIDAAGVAAFPNATLALPEADAAFYLDTAIDHLPEAHRSSAILATTATTPYQVTRLRPGEALPGITLVPLPGHTPGHSGYRIASADDALLIWGDIVHIPAAQLPRPELALIFDYDQAQAAATRHQIFAQAAAERLPVAGMHLDFPAFSHITTDGPAYRLIPDQWQPTP